MGTQFGGYHWNKAEKDGRIRPGRGPLFTRRVYPSRAPRLRKDALSSGVPRRTADRWEAPVRSVLLPPAGPTPAWMTGHRLGPDGWTGCDLEPYRWDILTRLRCHWLLAQDCVGSGWCAAAAHGLPYWADSESVVLLSRRLRRNPTTPGGPVFRRLRDSLPTVNIDPRFPDLRVVDAPTAAAQCVATILAGKKTWWAPVVPGFTDVEVRAIQFIDAFYQCTLVTGDDVLAGARHIVDRRRVKRLLELSDEGAQSPMETILRLIVRDELPSSCSWTSQATISLEDGEVLDEYEARHFRGKKTTPDLVCRELQVALYYDGRHHTNAEQQDTDFRLYQKLKTLGWEAVRINKDLIRDRDELLEHVRHAVATALRLRRTR